MTVAVLAADDGHGNGYYLLRVRASVGGWEALQRYCGLLGGCGWVADVMRPTRARPSLPRLAGCCASLHPRLPATCCRVQRPSCPSGSLRPSAATPRPAPKCPDPSPTPAHCVAQTTGPTRRLARDSADGFGVEHPAGSRGVEGHYYDYWPAGSQGGVGVWDRTARLYYLQVCNLCVCGVGAGVEGQGCRG